MNDQKLRTIRLYGILGKTFGREHRLCVQSTSEAIRALGVLYPGFRRFLINAKDKGLTFAVFNGKSNLDETQLDHPPGNDDIRIAPVIIGSKTGGLFQTILGAALVAAGFIMSNPALIGFGASMALGGIVQMISPQTSGLASTADNGTSYYFNGPVNSAAQGEPVPIVYGRMIVGSKRISSGIFAEDEK
ncbi:tail assembly protein [Burkholderia gladioli]|uniref:tail assembly protein n=1 Tax=Burkholderia gladioli TaxID=28095 RepID=UPI00163F69DF|nr:tail assembly protein [Burkholderia gladioli]